MSLAASLPMELISHILSFRPTHPTASMLKYEISRYRQILQDNPNFYPEFYTFIRHFVRRTRWNFIPSFDNTKTKTHFKTKPPCFSNDVLADNRLFELEYGYWREARRTRPDVAKILKLKDAVIKYRKFRLYYEGSNHKNLVEL